MISLKFDKHFDNIAAEVLLHFQSMINLKFDRRIDSTAAEGTRLKFQSETISSTPNLET